MNNIILVTGGMGFIGNYLIKKLKSEFNDFDIVSLDQYVRDYDDYIRADITSFGDLYINLKQYKGKIKYIIHAASEVGRLNGEEHPWKMIDSVGQGTLNLIQIALENDAKFIYFSTSEIYGDLFDEKTVKEEDDEILSIFKLNNIYSISKLFAESLVNHYAKFYGLKAVGVRPFMVYGPGVVSSKYKSALDIFVWNLMNNKQIYVDKNAVRSWCYIDDFVDGIICIMKNHNFKAQKYESYNIGNNKEYRTMEEIAFYIADELNVNKNLVVINEFDGKFKSQKKYFDTSKLENIGFKPKVTIEKGIGALIDWYNSLKKDDN